MNFEEWEKENSAELCPHVIKTEPSITKTRCRLCVWEAAQKKSMKEALDKWTKIRGIEGEAAYLKWLEKARVKI